MEMKVDSKELRTLSFKLLITGKRSKANVEKVLKTIGVIVQGDAVAKAPRSMTKAEYVSTLKGHAIGASQAWSYDAKRGFAKVGKVKTTTKRKVFTVGSLKNSIKMEVKDDAVSIFVPANSRAAKYAKKMHDERGKTWKNLGWQNDSKATDKYIEKAELEKRPEYMRAVNKLVDDIVKGLI